MLPFDVLLMPEWPSRRSVLKIRRWRGLPCSYCGEPMHPPTRDHVYPRSLPKPKTAGVAWTMPRLLPACLHCNQDKNDKLLEDWLVDLIRAGDSRSTRVLAIIERIKNSPG